MVLCDMRPDWIVFEDEWFVGVDKPAGLAVQGSRDRSESLLDQLRAVYGPATRLVHRIDQPASGLVLFARSSRSAGLLSAQFREGIVRRTYLAVVASRPPRDAGRLEHRITHHQSRNKASVDPSGANKARLDYRIAGESDRYWLLEIQLITGRHHQIRAQLAAIGCPIRGDLKYGARRSRPGGGIDLHALQIAFRHPCTGSDTIIEAPPPDNNLWNALMTARRASS